MFILKFIIIIILYFVIDFNFLKCLPIILPLILSIAFFTLWERKILAATQDVVVLML